jgi:hypothetical protein
MVRGSGLRATGLTAKGEVPEVVQYVTSKSVSVIRINEVVESGSNEVLRTEDANEPRIKLTRPDQTIRYTADIDFLRTDPGILSLMTNVPQVTNAQGEIVGFDATTRLPAAAFALEVWSKIIGQPCDPEGNRMWGYTLLPFLKGGIISGFVFQNGLVSFRLKGAQTRRGSKWGPGPYDLEGLHQRLLQPVSRNTAWRSFPTSAQPPTQQQGIQVLADDVIEGGSASSTTADTLDNEFAVITEPWIVDGGSAA